MGYTNKEAFLKANDLEERDIDLPSINAKVRIRALGGSYTRQISTEATVVVTIGDQSKVTVDRAKLEALQIVHALIEPKLATVEEALQFGHQNAKAYEDLIEAIDKLSGFDKEAVSEAEERFPPLGASPEGSAVENGGSSEQGSRRPDLPARAGA